MKYIAIGVVLVLFLYIQYRRGEARRKRLWILRLKEEWGRKPERTYADGEMKRISRYYYLCRQQENMTEQPALDDITWKDLNMDAVFALINHTRSSIGEEALYRMLRSPLTDRDVLAERSRLAGVFMRRDDLRLELEKRLSYIGKGNRLAVCDYLAHLQDAPCGSNLPHYLGIAAFVAGMVTVAAASSVGVLILVAVIAFQIITYYREKAKVTDVFSCVSQVVQIVDCGRTIVQLPDAQEIAAYLEPLEKYTAQLEPIQKKSAFLFMGNEMSGSPLDLLADYVKLLFHIDLIAYNQIIRASEKKEKEIRCAMEILGQLECGLAIASFRCYLTSWCQPVFCENGTDELFLRGENLYHPLIEKPVPNSVEAMRCQLITGSNASGKSTYLKTVAVNAILAQTLCTVSGTSYEAPFYQIYSSMALTDNLVSGESYYMAEIRSLKRILDRGQDSLPVLCFVDEVLRGTNTVERIAASAQILKSMTAHRILCFAATHDGELTYLLEQWYDNCHFEEEVREGDVLFSYRLMLGRAMSRNALKLLGLMGYDSRVLEEADRMAVRFEQTGIWSMEDEG